MRQRFVQDDDGHWYLIGAIELKKFEAWLQEPDYDYGVGFDNARINGSPTSWTFENAQEEK